MDDRRSVAARREALLRKVMQGERPSDAETAELAELMRRSTALSVDRSFSITMLVARLVALAALGLLLWFVPLMVYRCAPDGAGAARCDVQSTFAGVSESSTYTVRGIARAEPSADQYGVRFLDRHDNVLYERDDAAVAGTRMSALARRIGALADGTQTAPFTARQWPLVLTIIALVIVVFVAFGVVGAIGDWNAKRTGRAGSGRGASWVFAVGATLVGVGMLWLAPVVTWDCQRGDAGASCTIDERFAGLYVIERADVGGIASASSRTWNRTWETTEKGRTQHHSEAISEIGLADASGRVLYADEQSGAIGTSVGDLSDRVNALAADPAGQRFTVWYVPWVSCLFASIALLLGVPTLVALVASALTNAPSTVPGLAAVGLVVATLVLGWVLALMGRFPG